MDHNLLEVPLGLWVAELHSQTAAAERLGRLQKPVLAGHIQVGMEGNLAEWEVEAAVPPGSLVGQEVQEDPSPVPSSFAEKLGLEELKQQDTDSKRFA